MYTIYYKSSNSTSDFRRRFFLIVVVFGVQFTAKAVKSTIELFAIRRGRQAKRGASWKFVFMTAMPLIASFATFAVSSLRINLGCIFVLPVKIRIDYNDH